MATKLLNFFRSSTSHRLRIGLNLKGVPFEYVPIDLRSKEHLAAHYIKLNPQGLVPTLVIDERVHTQTPAILEWLEEVFPHPPLLPSDPEGRARVRALASVIACDVHPVNNRRILESLRHDFGADDEAVNRWCDRWISTGFNAIEAILSDDDAFCHGDSPTLADLYLIPQVESARRFGIDESRWPRIQRIAACCAELEPFKRAAPVAQPDAR